MDISKIKILQNVNIYGNTYLLTLQQSPSILKAKPGQFIMIFPGQQFDPLLGRPMSIHRINNKEKTFSILYHTIGLGTNILSKLKKNERIKIIGPLGNPISFNHTKKNFLLIAGGIGIAPLVWLADELVVNNKNVTMLIGGRSKNHIFPIKKLKQEIEVEIFTDDGSLGTKGLATKKINNFLSWTDEIILCGPEPMFISAHEIIKQYDTYIPAYALFEKEMACGIGICYGCAIKDKKNNPQLICTKGPSFKLSDIYL